MAFCLSPEGTPIVLMQRHGPFATLEQFLARATATGWDFENLPRTSSPATLISVACDSAGAIYVVGIEPSEKQPLLRLWYRKGRDWQVFTPADQWDHEVTWAVVRVDSADRPVIIAARRDSPDGWVRAYRPKNWPPQQVTSR
jgi:hypothetical protein